MRTENCRKTSFNKSLITKINESDESKSSDSLRKNKKEKESLNHYASP
jgi:hypothetical protein